MITLIFTILLIAFIAKLIVFALKATWGITKILLTIVFFPVILVVMAVSGFIGLALVALVIAGIVALIASAVAV